MKNLVSACKAKVMNNNGEETINTTLLTVLGIVIVSLFMYLVVSKAREAMSQSGNTISDISNQILNVQLPPEEDVYGDLVYVLEYSDAVYIPEESKNKIYELYVEKHWDTKRISKTMKIAEDRVRAVIKLRDRHQKFIDQGRYNKKFVDVCSEVNCCRFVDY